MPDEDSPGLIPGSTGKAPPCGTGRGRDSVPKLFASAAKLSISRPSSDAGRSSASAAPRRLLADWARRQV